MSMKLKKQHSNVSSSLENKKKLHQKITNHIKGIIRQSNLCQSEEKNMNAQKIPQKIIFKTKQTHKYLYKKSLINNKFQWLNKYIENSELQSLPINIEPNINRSKKTNRFENKQNQSNFIDKNKFKINSRSRTQAAQDQNDHQFSLCQKDKNFFAQRKSQTQNTIKHLQQVNLNYKIKSQKNFKLSRSKSLKDRKNVFDIANDHMKLNILKQRNAANSNHSNLLMQKNFSISNDTQKNQNKRNKSKNHKNVKIFIDQNTPARQFLDCTARLNSSNLMFKNTSGYIKNRKRQFIYQSREQKRQQSELLKIKRRFEEEITVQPWNPIGNDNQNQQNDFLM